MRALLDVNVLIALLDTGHSHHALASQWFGQNIASGWASCPITQSGCIRIMSQPSYPGLARSSADVAHKLHHAAQHASHQFWEDRLSLADLDIFAWQHIQGHRQITDAYLLALAVHHQARFVTFDRRIGIQAVRGAESAHLLLVE
ncbi:MAG: PIN domain-containing protein [Acidovorax sp.]